MRRYFRTFLAVGLLSLTASCGRNASDRALSVTIATNKGDIEIMLFNETPDHRDNFADMCGNGFYDSLLFHRVIESFVIQTGDPQSKGAAAGVALGDGEGGDKVHPEIKDGLYHIRGAVGAAREGDAANPQRLSSGSHFYIVQGGNKVTDNMLNKSHIIYPDSVRRLYRELGGTPHLDGAYTVFGYVINGMDVVDAIAATATDANDRPVDDIIITGTTLKRLSAEETKKYYRQYHAE
ncbi:MAG: peptidylprolyl isomerase [Rikenellaceae bacterium]|nr:peptidylprolyl isomerase [Rikenellaceae bacterium]MDE7134710.1 peptidylprolyl isomerase [Rikenellaceae bacterium]MDE7355913.1 peptidylprolyl isomerase [Rikenellaceae bacterium]